MDVNKDGTVTLREFRTQLRTVAGSSGKVPPPSKDLMQFAHDLLAKYGHRIDLAFDNLDKDMQGRNLTAPEFKAAMERSSVPGPHLPIFEEIDCNNDGTLSLGELVRAIHRAMSLSSTEVYRPAAASYSATPLFLMARRLTQTKRQFQSLDLGSE